MYAWLVKIFSRTTTYKQLATQVVDTLQLHQSDSSGHYCRYLPKHLDSKFPHVQFFEEYRQLYEYHPSCTHLSITNNRNIWYQSSVAALLTSVTYNVGFLLVPITLMHPYAQVLAVTYSLLISNALYSSKIYGKWTGVRCWITTSWKHQYICMIMLV